PAPAHSSAQVVQAASACSQAMLGVAVDSQVGFAAAHSTCAWYSALQLGSVSPAATQGTAQGIKSSVASSQAAVALAQASAQASNSDDASAAATAASQRGPKSTRVESVRIAWALGKSSAWTRSVRTTTGSSKTNAAAR